MTTRSDSHWRLFASLVAPHRRLLAAYGLALAFATALPLLAALLLSRFVDLAVDHAATGRLFRVAAGYVGLGLLDAIVSVLVVWRSTALAWAITDTLRRELAEFVFDADLAFHRDHTRGELVSRTDDDVTAMAQFLSRFVASTLSVTRSQSARSSSSASCIRASGSRSVCVSRSCSSSVGTSATPRFPRP